MPTAHELKNGPGMSGIGARKRHEKNPKKKAPREVVLDIRRTRVPVIVANASNMIGKTTRWRACKGAISKAAIANDASHISPQWYQV
jgi:hypothetical protein